MEIMVTLIALALCLIGAYYAIIILIAMVFGILWAAFTILGLVRYLLNW